MLSYVISATTSYLKPAILPLPCYDLAARPLLIQDDFNIPTFEPCGPSSSSSPKHTVIDTVLRENNLYSILGLPLYAPTASAANKSSLRRAYLSRSRACHPDKFPDFPPATLAFQKVSVAYDVLSSASAKRTYDAKLRTRSSTPTSDVDAEADIFGTPRPAQHAQDTFNGVLGAVFADFMEGDFEMIRTFLRAIHEINPAVNMGEESIESLINSFRALRELILVSQTYTHLIHLHLLRLLEIQHALRQLPYLDVCGRLRLTLQLARVTLEMPVAVDRALCEREEAKEREEQARQRGTKENRARRVHRRTRKGGILPAKLITVICCLVVVLEHSERVLR
ncbi:DnaJ-domain-containing protein [Ramaria rubella]|nr:DnaJ-domain-containing protein [Ramaria rubella]